MLAGGLVIWSGALGARRATTIIGAIELIVGVFVVLSDVMAEDASPTSVGSALFVIGAALVLGAQLLHRQTGETPPSTPGPSEFPGQPRAPQPVGAPYGPYGPGPYPGGPGAPGGPPSGPYPPPPAPPPQGPPAAPGHLGVLTAGRAAVRYSLWTTSTMSWPASVGFSPTLAPASRRASILAWAVPLPPETMAPAWPIFLPGGAVTPAM